MIKEKPPAVFPGKFNPPHMGHAITIAKLAKAYDLTVVVTTDSPEDAKWTPAEIADEMRLYAGVMGFKVETFDGTLTNQDHNPFDGLTILSGNPAVLEWAGRVGGIPVEVSRAGAVSGTDMRAGAAKFWKGKQKYPYGPVIKRRRLHELDLLAPKLDGVRSLIDIGCGDGALIKCLQQLTGVETFHAWDINPAPLTDIKGIRPKAFDIYDSADILPSVDFAIFAGVAPFVFEDDVLKRFLADVAEASPRLYLRAPCSMTGQAIKVAKFSEELGEDYFSFYRTPQQIEAMLFAHWSMIEHGRSYPDEIESRHGTKQFYWLCGRK